jgi:hypothetical protein
MIKVGFCVAYDWPLLMNSIPRLYQEADIICLSLDRNRRSWSGQLFSFDEKAFRQAIETIDVNNKIKIYIDSFYEPHLSPIENDNRQRSMMSKFLGEGGWHVQVDSDEYFLDFRGFVEYLKNFNPNPTGAEKAINICCNSVTVFKKLHDGFLVIDNKLFGWEISPIATNRPEYLGARRNSHFNHVSPFFFIHQSWAREENELTKKLNSWGHHSDFKSKDSYIAFWKSLDKYNYYYSYDFHPLSRGIWERLKFVEAETVDRLIVELNQAEFLHINRTRLFFKNSRVFAKLRAMISQGR